MLNRQTSRQVLDEAVGHASIVLSTTPDDPDYVRSADALASAVLALSEYLTHLDVKAAGSEQ